MEQTSPWLDPRFLVVAGAQFVTIVLFIGKLWFTTTNAHKRLDDLEAANESDGRDISLELKELKVSFYKHVADIKAHHNEEAVQEFRTALERRFTGLEKTLEDIARKLNHMAGRE